MPSEEQEEEWEALEAIYPELVRAESELLTFTIDLESETDDNQLKVSLQIEMPEAYPEVAPNCDVMEFENLDPSDCVAIEKFITQACEDQLGEIMCFTVISGVQDMLNDLVDEIERRRAEEEERKKREEEEAAQKKFIGTRVTVESFLQWKEKFDAELEALKTKEQKDKEAALKGRMTGKQLFLTKKAVDNEDVTIAMADQVEVDESLFENMDELDLDEDFEIPDE